MKRKALLSGLLALLFAIFGLMTAGPANAVVVGVCTIKANNPHGSNHVKGTINAVGTISCTTMMQEMFIKVYLEKANGQTWSNPSLDYFNTYYMSNNGAAPCSAGPGRYRTHVQYTIQAPPGINPRYTANNLYGPRVDTACGVATFATPGDSREPATQIVQIER